MSSGSLVVVDRAGRDVKRFPLARGLATLGSDLACDIRVLVPRVAPLHATVAVLAAQAVVRNVGDGETLLNGRAVSAAALRHGDLIGVGERALRWEYDEPRGRRDPGPSAEALAAPRARARPPRRSAAAPRARALLALQLRRPASLPPAGRQVAVVQPRRRDADAVEPLSAGKAQGEKRASRRRTTPRSSGRRSGKIEAPLEIDRTKRVAIMLMTGRSPAAGARREGGGAGGRAAQAPSPKAADSSRASRRSAAPTPPRRSARRPASPDGSRSGSLALRYSSSPGSPAARRSIRAPPGRRVESYSVVDLVSLDSADASFGSADSPAGRRARSALGASLLGCSTPYAPADADGSRTRSDVDDDSALSVDATGASSLASAGGTPEGRRSPEAAGTPVLSIRRLLESSRRSPAGAPAPAPRGSSGRRGRARPSAAPTVPSAAATVTPPGTGRLSPEAVKNKHSSAKRPLSKRSIIDDLDRSDVVKQLFSSPVKRKLSRSMVERGADEPPPRRARRGGDDGPALAGLRRLFRRASPADDLRDVRGVRELFARAPRDRLSDVRVKAAFGAAPRDELCDVRGVRRLFQHAAAREPASRSASGLGALFESPARADRSELLFDALVGKPPARAVYSKSLPAGRPRRAAPRARSLRGSADEIAGDVGGWLERELRRRLSRPAPPTSTPLKGRRAPAAALGRVSPIAPAGSARAIAAEEAPAKEGRTRRGRKAPATPKIDPPAAPSPPRRVTRNRKAAADAGSKAKKRKDAVATSPAVSPIRSRAVRAAKIEKAETPKRTRTRAARAEVASPKSKSPEKKVGGKSSQGKKKAAPKDRPAGPAATRKRPADLGPEPPEVSPKNVRRTRAAATLIAPGEPAPPAGRQRKVRFATPEATPKRTRGKAAEAPEPAPRARRARPTAAPVEAKGRKRKTGSDDAPPPAEPRPKRGRRVRDDAPSAPAGAAREAAAPTRTAPTRGRKAAEPKEKTVARAGGKRKPKVEPSPVKAAGRSRRR